MLYISDMQNFTYKTKGTCSRSISFSLDDDNLIRSVSFEGGCNGNLKGISTLAEGKRPEEIIAALKGIKCGWKDTSCPDQFASALEKAISK